MIAIYNLFLLHCRKNNSNVTKIIRCWSCHVIQMCLWMHFFNICMQFNSFSHMFKWKHLLSSGNIVTLFFFTDFHKYAYRHVHVAIDFRFQILRTHFCNPVCLSVNVAVSEKVSTQRTIKMIKHNNVSKLIKMFSYNLFILI